MKNQISPSHLLECCAPGGAPRTVSKEQLAAGREHMEKAFLHIIAVSDKDNYYWVGLHTDLLEIIYLVFLDSLVRDEKGLPMTLERLVEHSYAVLHLARPRNHSALITRALRRKGVRRQTMLERYTWLHYVRGITNPLADEIICISKDVDEEKNKQLNKETTQPNEQQPDEQQPDEQQPDEQQPDEQQH